MLAQSYVRLFGWQGGEFFTGATSWKDSKLSHATRVVALVSQIQRMGAW